MTRMRSPLLAPVRRDISFTVSRPRKRVTGERTSASVRSSREAPSPSRAMGTSPAASLLLTKSTSPSICPLP